MIESMPKFSTVRCAPGIEITSFFKGKHLSRRDRAPCGDTE
jgi:hypothetical protein